jgi:DNA-binding PadR family transcriptional regulator
MKKPSTARSVSGRIGNDDSPDAETSAFARLCASTTDKRTSHDLLQIEQGSLYPVLQRLLKAELVKAQWGVSSTNRRVRIYKLTAAGARHLEREVSSFERMLEGITRVLGQEES